jgi:alcohol dehydrogenase
MQQLTLVEKGLVAWREVAAPRVGSDVEAIVRPLAVSRCDIDLPYVTGLLPAPRAFALGHECVGEVVAVGDAVTDFAVGQRVIVPFQISCGACARCRAGHTGSCEAVPFLSAFGLPLSGQEWGGALSDAIRIPHADAMLVPAPEGVPAWQLAAVADNACDGWRCVAPALRARPGAAVLVVGGLAASVSLYAVDAALALGAERVDVVGRDPAWLALAGSLGANVLEGGLETRPGRYPVTVDASGEPDALAFALRATDLEGICTSAAYNPGEPVPVAMGRLYSKGISLHVGRCHARPWIPEVATALAEGRLHADRITTRRVAWSEAAEAMTEPALKLVVDREADT